MTVVFALIVNPREPIPYNLVLYRTFTSPTDFKPNETVKL